jgi:D-hydroxyproline dehydrogenase subunit gamma
MSGKDAMRIHDATPAATVELLFDGRRVVARAGESIAVALFANGVKRLRHSPRGHGPRGMFCLMGSCQECLVMVDGRRVLACQTLVSANLRVDPVPDTATHE